MNFTHFFLSQERDPFWEPDDAEIQIGSVQVYLQSLAYLVGTAWNLDSLINNLSEETVVQLIHPDYFLIFHIT